MSSRESATLLHLEPDTFSQVFHEKKPSNSKCLNGKNILHFCPLQTVKDLAPCSSSAFECYSFAHGFTIEKTKE
jgi:hypothetical protein